MVEGGSVIDPRRFLVEKPTRVKMTFCLSQYENYESTTLDTLDHTDIIQSCNSFFFVPALCSNAY